MRVACDVGVGETKFSVGAGDLAVAHVCNTNNLITVRYLVELKEAQECIILRQKYFDDEDRRNTTVDIEYHDTDFTNTIRNQLQAYNTLLKNSFIDIPSFSKLTKRS